MRSLQKHGKCLTLPDSDVGRVAMIAERVIEITEDLGVDLELLSELSAKINELNMVIICVEEETEDHARISCNIFDPNGSNNDLQ